MAPNEWTWMGGSSTVPSELGAQPGVYGTLGTPAAGNTPGGRNYAMGWTDNDGNLWLFGGLLFTTQQNYFNDLWKFDTTTGQWAWMSGSSAIGSNCVAASTANCGRGGIYGTLGTPAAGNTPGGRYQAETSVDSSGNFWLYGGLGFDANGNWGALSDLWRFNPSTNQWAWMAGSSTVPVTQDATAASLDSPLCPVRWGCPLPEIHPEDYGRLPVGPTTMATSGSLADGEPLECQTICGSSIPQTTSGHGWAVTPRLRLPRQGKGYTVSSAPLPLATSRDEGRVG